MPRMIIKCAFSSLYLKYAGNNTFSSRLTPHLQTKVDKVKHDSHQGVVKNGSNLIVDGETHFIYDLVQDFAQFAAS